MKNFAFQSADDSSEHSWSAAAYIPSQGESDFCSREGALALKEKIEAYWRARGMDVQLSMQNVGFHPAIRAARFDVRSDMINGMPRTATKTGSKRPATVKEENVIDLDDYSDDVVFE